MATNTYVALQTQVLSSSASSVTFSSISSSYTDLRLVMTATTVSGAHDWYLTFNGDTTSGLYSDTILTGNGSTATSTRHSGQNFIRLDNNAYMDATTTGNCVVDIMSYANTSVYKTVLARANHTTTGVDATVGLWRNTNAITSITIYPEFSGSFTAGSTFTLYGILAA